MAEDPRDFSIAELANIFDVSARASNREWRNKQKEMSGLPDFELPPAQQMFDRSPVVNYVRGVLPENVGEAVRGTSLGGWVANQAQKLVESQPQMQAGVRRAQAFAERIPLGGFSQEEKQLYTETRAADSQVRRSTVEPGMVPTADNRMEVRTKGDLGATAAQAAGVVAGDVASDGLRNIWWFINAPQALANLVADQNVQRAGNEILGRQSPIIKNRATRMAATLPAVLATSVGVGNVMREEGYKAVLPSDEDPRQSSNAAAELGARYFLGRTGGLLPYDEFVKERPDVSREEYNNYKNYLFANKSPVKASLDGIHGPEVNFMGKSIPLLTGIAPVAAAIYGSRRGLKGAGKKLNEKYKNPGEKDAKSMVERADESHALLRQMQGRRKGYEAKLAEFEAGEAQERPTELVTQEMLNAASDQYNDDQRKVERQALEGALAGGALGAGGGMIGGLALESVIRSLKPQYTAEDSE